MTSTERSKAWRIANPEKFKATQDRYRAKNREKILAHGRLNAKKSYIPHPLTQEQIIDRDNRIKQARNPGRIWYAGLNSVKNQWELFKSTKKDISTILSYHAMFSLVKGGYRSQKLAYKAALESISNIPVFILLDNLNQ